MEEEKITSKQFYGNSVTHVQLNNEFENLKDRLIVATFDWE